MKYYGSLRAIKSIKALCLELSFFAIKKYLHRIQLISRI
jgi:hypothetical protein